MYQIVPNSPTPPMVLVQHDLNNNDDVVVQLDENKTVYSKNIRNNYNPASTPLIKSATFVPWEEKKNIPIQGQS